MRNLSLLLLGGLFLISATVQTTITIFKPAAPKETIILSGYFGSGDRLDLQNALAIYNSIGYKTSHLSYTQNGSYIIILEKY